MSRFRLSATVGACCWMSLLPAPGVSILAAENLRQATGETQSPIDEAQLRGSISKEIRQNAELRGSWVKVFGDSEQGFRVTLVVDSETAVGSKQETQLRALVLKLAGAKFTSFNPTEKVPVRALLKKIASETSKAPQFAGLQIRDARFSSSGSVQGQLNLLLNGSASKADQAEVLEKLCNEKWWPAIAGTKLASTMTVGTSDIECSRAGEERTVKPNVPRRVGRPDESRLRSELPKLILKTPEVRGSWAIVKTVDEDESLNSLYVMLVVDSDESIGKSQEAELRKLVGQVAGSDFNMIRRMSEKLPIAALLTKIRTETEDDPRLVGTRILTIACANRSTPVSVKPQSVQKSSTKGAKPIPTTKSVETKQPVSSKPKLFLRLNGSVTDRMQAELLGQLCNEKWLPAILSATPGASKFFDVSVDAVISETPAEKSEGMTLRVALQMAAVEFFDRGIDAFLQQKYQQALENLTLATQDDPSRPEIKYWRVAALIALKQDRRAREVIKRMTPANNAPNPYYTSEVLKSLERLNGGTRSRIRQQLDSMVREAVSGP
jgi:hypothetical protein